MSPVLEARRRIGEEEEEGMMNEREGGKSEGEGIEGRAAEKGRREERVEGGCEGKIEEEREGG